jgi:predicted phosphoribosyltransferase
MRDRTRIFRDRPHAGEVLADMLFDYRNSEGVVLGAPAGGIPVAAVVAEVLGLPLDVAVVSKITLPWNTEAGYGAVAFDGTVRLNENLLRRLDLSPKEIEEGIRRTRRKVEERIGLFRGERPLTDLSRRAVILVDDGLASGFTMQVAVEALRNSRAGRIIVAVPTGHTEALERIGRMVEAVYCANVRGGPVFAVAEAYIRWSDVDEKEVLKILGQHFSRKS